MAEKVAATPADNRQLILTREAAKVIGCSMSNLRWLAQTGRLSSWRLGPRSLAFDLDECRAYKKEQAAQRAQAAREGRRGRGKPPQGFTPDKHYGSIREEIKA
jgi:hypothetical protein